MHKAYTNDTKNAQICTKGIKKSIEHRTSFLVIPLRLTI